MRWFKHFTDAGDDEVIALMIEKYGLGAYGLWWKILEVIARQMTKGSERCEATYPKRKWCDLCSIYHQSRFDLVTIFLQSRHKLGLIYDQSDKNLLTISCPKLLEIRDEYQKKSGHSPDKLRKVSGQTTPLELDTELQRTNSEKNKDIYCAVDTAPPSPRNGNKAEKIPYQEIIEYLNQKSGKAFKWKAAETQRHIKARWNGGFRMDDFKRVIDLKCEKWMTDPKMIDYMRPVTLFGTKFESYLNESNTKSVWD